MSSLVSGGVFLLNSPFGPEEVWSHLPRKVQEQLIAKRAKLYVIDAYQVARDTGMVELSLPETLVLGCSAVVVQCFFPDRPKPVQVIFNLCASAWAIAAAYQVYYISTSHGQVKNPSLQLLAAASMYFLANTVPVATVIALTEHKSLRSIFTDYYFWSFPHYLLGAGVAGLIGFFNRFVEWQSSLLVLPAIFLIYRSYRLYLSKLENEKRHVEEMANLHLRTIEALALAIEAKDHTTH